MCHPQLKRAIDLASKRGFEGWATPGTSPCHTTRLFRVLAALSQVAAVVYIAWRALRSLGSGYVLLATIPFWMAEFFSLLLGVFFIVGLWNMIDRPARQLGQMLRQEEFPTVDVFVVCFSEPLEVGVPWSAE